MFKKIYYIITSLCIIISLTSCSEDYLNIEPEQNVSAESAVTDVNTLQTALNGVYSKLQSSGYYGRNIYVIPELMADNIMLSTTNTGRYLEYNGFVVSEQDVRAEELWNACYETIANANRAIKGGENLLVEIPEQEESINQLVGEAYALRAMAHFDLTRFFAQPYNTTESGDHLGIPVVTEVSDEEISPSRSTVKEDYDQITADIEAAISRLNLDKNEGRFTINSARALYARVALYQENFEQAVALSSSVIDSGEFTLIPNAIYFELWSTEFNNETLFEIVNTITDNESTNSLGHFFDEKGYADALVTEDLFNVYDSEDARLSAIKSGSKTGAEEFALFVNKFPQGTNYDDNIKVLRLAEQYLIRSEAYARLGDEDLARIDVQTIANRGNPDTQNITESGEALIDRILLERRKELAFEGHRLFDLNRNKKDIRIVQSENIIEATYPNEKFILPIPINEINANQNIKPQNPGY